MFLDLAQFRGADERIIILLREGGRDNDIQIDLLHHAICWVRVDALYELNAFRGNSTLLTESKHIDAGACANGCEKEVERHRCAGCWRLVCWNREASEMCIDTRSTGEVDKHFHFHIRSLSAAAATLIALKLQLDLCFEVEFFVGLRVRITRFIVAPQRRGKDISDLIIINR